MVSSPVDEVDPLLDNIRISEHLESNKKFVKQAKKLRNCCKNFEVFIDWKDSNFVKFGTRCGYRVCLYCSKVRSCFYYNQFIDHIRKIKIPKSMQQRGLRFLTLTLVNQKNLKKGINLFYKSFTKFKRRKYFKDRIMGGLGTIEAKKGEDKLWNIHGHFLIDSKYLDMKSHKRTGKDSLLVREWTKSTRGSSILFLKNVRDYQGSLNYILKYLVKGIENLTPKQKAEFFKITYKRRLIFTFGNFYGIRRPVKPKRYQWISPFSEEYESYLDSDKPKRKKELEDWID